MAFIDEVNAQPDVLENLLNFYEGAEGQKVLGQAFRLVKGRPVRSLVFLGMGTSYYVPLLIRGQISPRYAAVIWDAGEFLHSGLGSVNKDDVVIAISQSGESVETKKCVEALKNHGRLIALTNDPDSIMARLSSLNLPLMAGQEASISTKTYTNSMALLLVLAQRLMAGSLKRTFKELRECGREMRLFFAHNRNLMAEAGEFLRKAVYLHFIARGPCSAAALQASLTWMEGVHLANTAFSGGSFRHGPLEMAGKGHHAVVYAPEGKEGELTASLAEEISRMGSKVVLFSGGKRKNKKNLLVIPVRPPQNRVFSLSCAVPQEMLLAEMAQARSLVPGHFAHISKVTRVE